MPEIIQNWLGSTLGVLLDMTPEKFGRNTKDGKLLAQVLYNYSVIPKHVFNSIKESKNFYECYNNLVTLKPWLRHIGVTHDESTLKKMASGEGSSAISVFYAVYLNLERKDRLSYLSAQKERRFSPESCQKFKVSWVPESFVNLNVGDSLTETSGQICEVQEMIDWHRAKCRDIVEQIKKTKAKFQKITEKKPLAPLVSKHVTSQPLEKSQSEVEETFKNLKDFEKKYPCNNPNLNYSELVELQNITEMQPCLYPSLTEAKNIIGNIKRRKKGDVYAKSFQHKMQDILLDEQWKQIIESQDKDFENKLCANLLKQSQYEKQMANKLYMLRNQKKVLAENRRKMECLKLDQCQKEYDELLQKNMEMKGECWEEEEFEMERIAELHRRLYDEKARLRRAELKAECQKIFSSLVDIAMRISEVRDLIGGQIPKSFMKDLKELFFKDLSIFDLLDHLEQLFEAEPRPSIGLPCECEGEEEEEEECVFLEGNNGSFAEEKHRQAILNECDFNDYLHLMGPWMVDLLFPNGSESEVQHLVLGYIVHKILAVKYPPPRLPVRLDIKPMRPAAVVLGFADENATNMLVDLMEVSGILVVRVDDAINFVLSAYKEELSVVRDIDIVFQKATDKALKQKSSSQKTIETKKKVQLLKKESKVEVIPEDLPTQDKETQTPRMIPDDDPLLSPTAELGKQAFEALGAGDPVSDPVIVSSIIAYVVSQQDSYDGWVLLNYPNLYSQASSLEYFLTGFHILPETEEMETLEDVEGFNYRGPWGDPFSNDEYNEERTSRLVPKPDILKPVETVVPKTYFSSFIQMRKAVEASSRSKKVRESEPVPEVDPLVKFYSEVGIFLNFEYPNMNFQTVKNLGKIILGVNLELGPRPSLEIFGEAILKLNEKWAPAKKSGKNQTAAIKKTSESIRNYEIQNVEQQPTIEEEDEEEEEVKTIVEISSPPPKPGDPTWEWATGPQPEPLLMALACLWENMEAIYTEDFKDIFFYLRVHRTNLIEYSGFVRKSIQTMMVRGDDKQKFLGDFQQMYNEIDEDLRPDVDIKCELHTRVTELEQALMTMADERKANSLKDINMAAQDGWVPDEMATLINIFLTAIQLEVDRCLTSCQCIADYYTSLQQKIPDDKQLRKVIVPKLQIQDRKYSVLSSNSSKTMSSSLVTPRTSDFKRSVKSLNDPTMKTTRDRASKTRGLNEKRKRSSDIVAGAADFLMGVLANLSLPEDGMTPFHSFFMDNVNAVVNEVKVIVEGCISEAKKGEKPPPTNRNAKSNKTSEEKVVAQNGNPTAEWLTALENEISRFNFRTQLILARGIFEMNEFLTTILNMLSSLSEDVLEMYLKEVNSISECCKVFRCAIEEEIPIKPILRLKVDEFFVCMNDEVPPNSQSSEETLKPEEDDEEEKFRFTINQLCLLFHKLQRVAPDGEIIKRSLVYIIEDLRTLKSEVENCFPEIWNEIEPDDVTKIMDEVFQDLEIVHWKDFIIYALELPLPTESEILSMRRCFRSLDPEVTELINRENYDTVPFWFEKETECENEKEEMEKIKQFLYMMYQVDHCQTNYSAMLLAFCKDEDPVAGFKKGLALATGKVILVPEESEDVQSFLGENECFDFGPSDDYSVQTYNNNNNNNNNNNKPCCCPTNSMNIKMKCIPRERIRCDCKDETETLSEETTLKESLGGEQYNFLENEGESYIYYDSFREQSFVASVVPYGILSSLLKASFPSLPQLSILLDCDQTFQETLSSIYDSLDSHNNTVEVRKLLKHNFINRLLHCTNKFKFVKLKPILMSVAKFQSPMSRVTCVKEKPNVSPCLRN